LLIGEYPMLNKIFRNDIQDYKAKDLMTKGVITLPPQDDLLKAQTMMARHRIKKIIVVDDRDNRHPVGIITVKDIIKFLITHKLDRDLDEIPIIEAMTKRLITINEIESVIDCAKILDNDHNSTFSSLIVVEKGGPEQREQQETSANIKILLSGIITSTDFTRFFSEKGIGLVSVQDYMSHPVFSISINEKVSTAAELMIEKNVSRLVVTSANSHRDRLLGILSETDISRVTTALQSKTLRSVYEYMQIIFSSSKRNKLDNLYEPTLVRIRDIFTPNPTWASKDTDLAKAAKIMIRQRISGIPVVDSILEEEKSKNEPIGIISKTDIIKALTDIV
jgi:CBS domain-containing protein